MTAVRKGRRILWFAGLYAASIAGFALVVYALRALIL